ncbi:hypothetical protein BM221_005927 [Beauveria bassiana]|uniref:Uncharacterized protein n=1 Tax=Beauveria bassiana TaxID=176275 RepID=A0A2N6NKH2_BEABA|nr:hypothetical protein BM221_005927 [Beauveria bassiana]
MHTFQARETRPSQLAFSPTQSGFVTHTNPFHPTSSRCLLQAGSASFGEQAAQTSQDLHHGHLTRARAPSLPVLAPLEPRGRQPQHRVRLAPARPHALLQLVHAVGEVVDLELERRLNRLQA